MSQKGQQKMKTTCVFKHIICFKKDFAKPYEKPHGKKKNQSGPTP